MAVSHTTALELLGKAVSFESVRHVRLTDKFSIDFTEKLSGIVTGVTVYIDASPEILIDEEFYVLSEIRNFEVAP